MPQNRWTAIEWYKRAAAQGDTASGDEAKRLGNPMNNAGFYSNDEGTYFMSNGLHWLLSFPDPAGTLFRNKAERGAYVVKMRAGVSCQEALAAWHSRLSNYNSCRSGGGETCLAPGAQPHC